MKSKLLALSAVSALCVPMIAVTNMCIKRYNGEIVKIDVENIEEVFYVKDTTSVSPIPNDTTTVIPSDTTTVIPSDTTVVIPSDTTVVIPSDTTTVIPSDTVVPEKPVFKLSYSLLEDSTLEVLPTCTESVVVKDTAWFNGESYKISSIGDTAFYYCTDLKSLEIGSNVERIGNMSFFFCKGLTNVTIPSNVKYIANNAFGQCSNLDVVIDNWEDRVTAPSNAFAGCKSVTYTKKADSAMVDVENTAALFNIWTDSTVAVYGVDSTKAKDYNGIYSFYTLTIPEKVRIGNSVYRVTGIEYGAFDYKTHMIGVEIPSSVEYMNANTFAYCPELKSINVSANNQHFCSIDGILYNKDTSVVLSAPRAMTGEVELPSSVNTVAHRAFAYCDSLTKIVVPASVDSIGDYAFASYNSYEVVIDNEEEKIYKTGENSFYGTNSVTWLKNDPSILDAKYLPYTFTVLGDTTAAITGCVKDSIYGAVSIPSKVRINGRKYEVRSIGSSVFEKCIRMTSIELPESVRYIENGAFSGCSGLTKVGIPPYLYSVGDEAFVDCLNLMQIELPSTIYEIGSQAFAYCKKLSVVVNNKEANMKVGSNAFYGCASVKFME